MATSATVFYGRAAAVAAAIILLLAPLEWPYGYYRFLRVAVTVAAAGLCVFTHRIGEKWLSVALFLTLLTFNPLVPLGLEKDQWVVLNLLGAAVFFVAFVRVSGVSDA